ncbi:M20/M25/M40 family metallo-hydrolase [Roseomonas marmotae]|uniref:M20/M25/M40 family metallo-hydrolase n=1 Tax=Roseomonas marmotae TaxID=2768161 RepID=A0ABS3KFZ7_9PROT|nr:M20/M25/M40 family metallo-hydrolase [Roseomonas marmotae]MBO1076393.1 M20/M25/M40 family metallo-hydrolase [Roseomonas marmotae]QTI79399.1 M20/M25/M40 family metallo-hydrolase [Roseomonas marmotae]
MAERNGAIARARQFFDQGSFKALLSDLVAIPSTSQEPGREEALHHYLESGIRPWVERMGFQAALHENPEPGFGPILMATRIEDPARPTVLLYGHGDTVAGLDAQWSEGLSPWTLTERDGRWYGRGTADNKGQHVLNLAALEAVLAERGGKLGFNVKLVLEMAEERGSKGLRKFIAAQAEALAADVLIASDGPRVEPGLATIATGTRGTFHFDLAVRLREGGVHSGHWGGLTSDPAVILAHALSTIMDRNGKILVRGWLPSGGRDGAPPEIRKVLQDCPVGGAEGAATIDEGWGEPGLTSAEKIYGWNSFIVLAMVSGVPENPVNAVAPHAVAHCQIRYTVDTDPETFEAALRHHLDIHGLETVRIENAGLRMPASRTAPDHPWVRWAQESMEKSLGSRVQIIPNSSGGLPGDVFIDHLGVPLVWVPHSYNGCKQHGPDEHLLIAPAREGIAAFAGMWWDLGEAGTPSR